LISSLPFRTAAGGSALDLVEVHERYADFVWRTLQRMGVRDSDLDDALQEVFVVVHRKLWRFDGSSALTTWLFGICLRVASATRRKAYRHRERLDPDWAKAAGESAEGQPETELLAREARTRLAEVLDELEPARRAVLVMFEIEALSCAEIAAQLGIPVGTVYSRLSAARADFLKATTRFRRRDERGDKR
jgi:RNA polymerase sigma-70 factor (ECF subfamily)